MKENIRTLGFADKTMGELFGIFVSTDEMRMEFAEPFLKEGRIYATDAHSLISIDANGIDFKNDNKGIKAGKKIPMPETNSNIKIVINEETFIKYKTEEDCDVIGKDIECEVCDGWGEVEWAFEEYSKDFECPKCDGDGLLGKAKYIPNGKMKLPDDFSYFVKVGESYIHIIEFYKLMQVQSICCEDIILLHRPELQVNPSLFSIGAYQILMMPCNVSPNKDQIILTF